MEILLTLHDQMQSEYTKTAKFFGEDPTMTTTEEFFGIFSTFLDQFEVTVCTSCGFTKIYTFSKSLFLLASFLFYTVKPQTDEKVLLLEVYFSMSTAKRLDKESCSKAVYASKRFTCDQIHEQKA